MGVKIGYKEGKGNAYRGEGERKIFHPPPAPYPYLLSRFFDELKTKKDRSKYAYPLAFFLKVYFGVIIMQILC